MRKNFISNLVFLLFLNLLVKPFWILGIDRTVQNNVGPAEYGTYFALFNFSFLFQVILDFGFNNYNNRMIAENPERLKTYFSTTLIAKLMFAALYTVIVWVAAFGIGFNTGQISILFLLVVMQILLSFYVFLRSNVAALQLFKTDAVLSVLDKFLAIVICILLLRGVVPGFTLSIQNFILAQITAYLVAGIVACLIIFRHAISIRFHFDSGLVKEIIQKSLPYALLGFLMAAYYRIDAVMIERMSGDDASTEAGIYASAFRLLDALNILGYLFAGILLPLFTRMIATQVQIHGLLQLSFKLMLLLSFSSGIAILFYRDEIMSLLYTTGDAYSGKILGCLMISFICISLIYVFGSLLTANGNIRILNRISIAGLLMNVVLNLFLIPREKAFGAAIATIITQIIVLVAHIVASEKVFRLKTENTLWIFAGLYAATVILLNLAIAQIHTEWYNRFILAIAASLVVAIPARLFRWKEIRLELKGLLGRENQD